MIGFLPHRKAYNKSRWRKKKARIWKRIKRMREQKAAMRYREMMRKRMGWL